MQPLGTHEYQKLYITFNADNVRYVRLDKQSNLRIIKPHSPGSDGVAG